MVGKESFYSLLNLNSTTQLRSNMVKTPTTQPRSNMVKTPIIYDLFPNYSILVDALELVMHI